MYFFFSYSRRNSDTYLRAFFDDLNNAIKALVGIDADAGFFDQTGLEPGDFWEAKLEASMASARVFVAAVTAGYVRSDYCGREWQAFEERIDLYAKRSSIKTPPLILPILWIPPAVPLPQEIADRQYKVGDPADVHNKEGLVRLFKLRQLYDLQRENYLTALANKIISLHDQHAALDQVNDVSKLASTKSAFTQDTTPAVPGNASVKGPQRVHFVFGAAAAGEVAQSGRRNVDAYGGGGEEWQPYFPVSRKIGSIARQTAALDEFNLWPGEMTVSPNLPQQIREAERLRELVVIFVDSWTAALPQYVAALQNFDQQNYVNCSVLVPWNEADQETQAKEKDLLDWLKRALRFRSGSLNDLYYKAQVKSEADLRKELGDVLTRLRAEVINKSVPDAGVIPASPGARPIISGPGK